MRCCRIACGITPSTYGIFPLQHMSTFFGQLFHAEGGGLCSSCFSSWYAAEQRWKREQRQKLLEAKKHAVTGQMLDELGLQTHDHGLFTILCPTCRSVRSPEKEIFAA